MIKKTIIVLGLLLLVLTVVFALNSPPDISESIYLMEDVDNTSIDSKGRVNANFVQFVYNTVAPIGGNSSGFWNGSNYMVRDANATTSDYTNFLYSAYINVSVRDGQHTLFEHQNSGGGKVVIEIRDNNRISFTQSGNIDIDWFDHTIDVPLNEIVHIMAWGNATKGGIWLNSSAGVETHNESGTFSFAASASENIWMGFDENANGRYMKNTTFDCVALYYGPVNDDVINLFGNSTCEPSTPAPPGNNTLSIVIDSPTNTTITSNVTSLDTTFTTSGSLDVCKYSLDGAANVTMSGCLDVSGLNIGDGQHTFVVIANTTTGVSNITSVSFTVNTTVAPIGGCGVGFLSESCVIDRSVCAAISNDLEFACFRNDTNPDFTNPFNPKDLFDDTETSNLYLAYEGSMMRLFGDDIVNYKTGVGRMKYRMWDAIVNKMITVDTGWSTQRWTGWGFIFNGAGSGSRRAEGYVVPINKYAWVVHLRIKCIDGDDCNQVSDMIPFIHDSDQNKEWRTDISGGNYSGFQINVTEAANVFSTKTLNETFLIAFNESPDSFDLAATSTQAKAYFNMTNGQTKDITIVVTIDDFEQNITEWLTNPVTHIDNAINHSLIKHREMTYPTLLNISEKQYYFSELHNIFYNTICSNPAEQNTSNFGSNCVYAPSMSQYRGTWIWDSFFTCMGILQITEGNSSLLDTCVQNLAVWHDFTLSDRDNDNRMNREIHEYNTNNNSWQPNGGWSTVALRLFERGAISQNYLCNDAWDLLKGNYDDITGDHTKNNQISSPSGSTMGWDGAPRFASGGTQLDATGWSLIDARALNNMASICGNSTAQSQLQANITSYSSGMESFWDETEGEYTDRNSTFGTYYFNNSLTSPAISPASCWIIVSNGTNNQTRIDAIFNSWGNTSRLSYSYILPTLITTHQEFNPAGTGGNNWAGRVWSPPNIMCMGAASKAGNSGNLSVLSQATLDRMSINFLGYESYRADTGGLPSSSFNFRPYAWAASEYYTAVWQKDLFVFNISAANDTTDPVVTISFPENITYITNITDLFSSVTDNVLVDKCWYNLGSGNVSFPCGNNLTVGSALGQNTWTVYANDTSGNIGSTSITFTYEIADWEARFNLVDIDRLNRHCVLNFALGDALFGEQNECMEAYENMWYYSGNESYLDFLIVQMDNMTNRWFNLGQNLSPSDFRYNHMRGLLAETAYTLKNSTNAGHLANATIYTALANNMTEGEAFYKNWSIGGIPMGRYTNSTGDTYTTRPNNQDYKVFAAHAYLFNLTGNSAHYTKALQIANGLAHTIRTEVCAYNTSKLCNVVQYRFNYTQPGEGYGGLTFGFPPSREESNYLRQQLEMFQVGYRHGFINATTMERFANTITNNQYIREGDTRNVLLARTIGYPSLTFLDDFHVLARTGDSASWDYFNTWDSGIQIFMVQVMNRIYNFADNGGGSYTWFTKPYANITDPRNQMVSFYLDDDNAKVLPNTMLKHISTYLLNGTRPLDFFTLPTPSSNITYGDIIPQSEYDLINFAAFDFNITEIENITTQIHFITAFYYDYYLPIKGDRYVFKRQSFRVAYNRDRYEQCLTVMSVGQCNIVRNNAFLTKQSRYQEVTRGVLVSRQS